jgi:hypothetical protein
VVSVVLADQVGIAVNTGSISGNSLSGGHGLSGGPSSGGYDPSLVQAARQIYQTYYQVHPTLTDRPLGVAINRLNYRGKLVFVRMPALLPQECFIPFELFA